MYLAVIESEQVEDAYYVGQTKEETEAGAPKTEEKKKEPEKKSAVATVVEAAGAAFATAITAKSAAKGAMIEPVSPEGGAAKLVDGGLEQKSFGKKYGLMLAIGAVVLAVPVGLLIFSKPKSPGLLKPVIGTR